MNVRQFLYACAYWAVAADEELKPSEQQWLKDQFGEEGATSSLDDFVSLESGKFYDVFDSSAARLTDEEKRDIYPELENWLYSCVTADGTEGTEERDIILKIKNRLSLKTELRNVQARGEEDAGAVEDARGPAMEQTGEGASVFPQPVSDYTVAGEELGVLKEKSSVLTGHEAEVTVLDLSGDGKKLVSGSEDGTVRIWDWAGAKQLMREDAHEMGVLALRCAPQADRAVSGDRLGDVIAWDLNACSMLWKKQGKKKISGGVTGIDISADGKKLCASLNTGMVTLWDFEAGEPVSAAGQKKWGSINTVRFAPDGKELVSGGDDGMLRFWSSDNLEVEDFIHAHDAGVTRVDISSDGKLLVSVGRDNMVRFWDRQARTPVREMEGHNFSVYDVSFSADDKLAVSASWDHTLRLWDVASGTQLLKIESIDGRFSTALMDAETECIMAGSSEKVVHIFKLNRNKDQGG